MAVSVGDKVEIICQEDGYWGSYYVAKVVRKTTKKCLVEYTTLVTETDKNVFLREIVGAHMVRPLPPKMKVSRFNIVEKVDAYANEGWWEGIITGKKGSDYTVYFENFGVSETHPVSRLRLHQDYVDGRWINSLGTDSYADRFARLS